VLGIEPRAMLMLGKHASTGAISAFVYFVLEMGVSLTFSRAGLEFSVLPLFPKQQEYRCVPPYLASFFNVGI
jgi:hypothetical protein